MNTFLKHQPTWLSIKLLSLAWHSSCLLVQLISQARPPWLHEMLQGDTSRCHGSKNYSILRWGTSSSMLFMTLRTGSYKIPQRPSCHGQLGVHTAQSCGPVAETPSDWRDVFKCQRMGPVQVTFRTGKGVATQMLTSQEEISRALSSLMLS